MIVVEISSFVVAEYKQHIRLLYFVIDFVFVPSVYLMVLKEFSILNSKKYTHSL